MTRIIAGLAGGRRLRVPSSGTRPTSDRVREALFSSLESAVEMSGCEVLDLYAGSGALGLEALSRGARRAVLVEVSREACAVIRANVSSAGLPGAHVRRDRVRTYLSGKASPFDLVLADPPYDTHDSEVQGVLEDLTHGWVHPGAVVVVERGARGQSVVWPQGYVHAWDRRFGDTEVHRAVWYGRGEAHDAG